MSRQCALAAQQANRGSSFVSVLELDHVTMSPRCRVTTVVANSDVPCCWEGCGVALHREVRGPKGRGMAGWHQQSAGEPVHLGHTALTALGRALAEQAGPGTKTRVTSSLLIFPSPKTEDPGLVLFAHNCPGFNLSVRSSCLFSWAVI